MRSTGKRTADSTLFRRVTERQGNGEMKLKVELEESSALIRCDGYVNRPGGERLRRLLVVLTTLGVREVRIDLSASPLVCVTALERLIDAQVGSRRTGMRVDLVGLTPTLRKVLEIMGFHDPSEALRNSAEFAF